MFGVFDWKSEEATPYFYVILIHLNTKLVEIHLFHSIKLNMC